jgi:hypothetical protein
MSPTELLSVGSIPVVFASAAPVATECLENWIPALLKARRAAKCAGTSAFLMRLMAAPMIRLPAWTVLVWSEAWRAEGEKKRI